jgi:hypothetical protein
MHINGDRAPNWAYFHPKTLGISNLSTEAAVFEGLAI